MRPRRLRRRLILAGLGGCIAAATITTAAAKASPDVCATLQASPTVGAVENLVIGLVVNDGLTPGDAGEVIAISVLSRCPEYRPVLERFIAAYTPAKSVRA